MRVKCVDCSLDSGYGSSKEVMGSGGQQNTPPLVIVARGDGLLLTGN